MKYKYNPFTGNFETEPSTLPLTFSTDTATLVYAPSTTYTLVTLEDAPIGTFITYTYASGTNTRTQTTTAPGQSTSDMNLNGIRLFPRAFNANSFSSTISNIAIQIGKGLKHVNLRLYRDNLKGISGELDYYITGADAAASEGMRIKSYDESSGVLYLDAGFQASEITSARFLYTDGVTSTAGYVVIRATA